MASPTQEESTKLLNIYHQIENATSLFDLLGLPSTGSPTPKDVKTAYHALALQIHPDKCQPGQIELHTRLFKKVQDAYEQLTEYQETITKDPQPWQHADSREEAFGHIFLSMAKKMSEDEGVNQEDEAARQQEEQRYREYQDWKYGLLRDYGIGRWG